MSDKPVVVIAGCSGLIGSRLTRALCGEYRVAGLDIEPPKVSEPGSPWTECDMTDDEGVAAALNWVSSQFGNQIASVIHLAAYDEFSGEPCPLYRELIMEGARRLLRHLLLRMTGRSAPPTAQRAIVKQ